MGLPPPEGSNPADRAHLDMLVETREIELDQARKRRTVPWTHDRLSIAVTILVALIIVAVVVYVLATGGFGNPPPPTLH